jgi:hypothetical protein
MRQILHTLLIAGISVALPLTGWTADTGQTAQSGALRVVTHPASATVYVDRQNRGVAPVDISGLTPGKHLVEIQKERYQTARKTITIEAGKRAVVDAELSRTKALLLVKTTPAGASVKINGIDRGDTPLMITDLDTGTYRLHLSAPGHISKEIQVQLPDERPRLEEISLISDFGQLVVNSDPAGADVMLNGISKGTTPITIERIPTGSTTLEIHTEGYERYRETIKLTAGESQTIDCELEPIPACLRVVTIPLKARVYVNNEYQGNAPVFLQDLPPGDYRVRAELPNYDPVAQTVTLKRADRVVKEFRLAANVGTVKVTTEPAGVEVLIDGTYEDMTATTVDQTDNVSELLTLNDIRSGTRKFSFVHKDYFTHEEDVTVVRDDTVTLHVKLERRFIPNLEIRTRSAVYTGVYQGLDINGDIKLEVRPGITQRFSSNDVISSRPIKETPPEDAVKGE